ncbi:glutaminase, partial [Burkholderia thailandensis]
MGAGRVADDIPEYIPELAKVPAERFGMAVVAIDRGIHTVGDARERL